jgi:hypothetical protein
MEYLLKEGIKQMARQHLGLRLETLDVPVSKKLFKVKIPIPFPFYSNELRNDSETIFTRKLPKYKAYSRDDYPVILISENVESNFVSAEIYLIERKNKFDGPNIYSDVVLVPFFSVEYNKIILMKLEDFKKAR